MDGSVLFKFEKIELQSQGLLMIGMKKISGLVIWIVNVYRSVSTGDVERLLGYKISKVAWDWLERKRDNNLFTVVKDIWVGLKLGTFRCSALKASHSEAVPTKSTVVLMLLVMMNIIFKSCMINKWMRI